MADHDFSNHALLTKVRRCLPFWRIDHSAQGQDN